MRNKNSFNFANTPLSREEFLKKYGIDGNEQLLSIPIEVGKDETEQFVFMNINQTVKCINELFKTVFRLSKSMDKALVEIKRTAILVTTSIAGVVLISVLILAKRNH